ncbi:DNA-binding protein [Bacillus cereus]|uniref:DNA-binding protein n=1 Tax=Bacillus cereus group sp. BfR-BA-01319 TaxID=2920296 RepID=UPI001298D1B1|nr:DNA-binding protein [Bacillus cereus group sp. BfR-BA-01319]MDA2537629.1 DNA-binding protein [Bacillus cereus]MRC07949.1 DNA-binding protein [Bacillus thuringiensis]MEB9514563.1 DNA-binding protein [Bacillus cereus]MEB9565483.1 DNA-binding protein [Bacillus cereus]MEC2468639.1 DNA-binding protein [Bacillus cereus]
MYEFKTKDELICFIQSEIVNTSEALDILGCSRQNLNQMVQKERVKPIKEMPRDRLFFKADILKRKEQMRK